MRCTASAFRRARALNPHIKIKTCLISDLKTDLIIMSENSGGGFYILSKYKAGGYDDNLVKAELRDIKSILKNMQGRIETPLHRKRNGLISLEALLKRTGPGTVISVLSYEPRRDGEVMPVPKRWLVVPNPSPRICGLKTKCRYGYGLPSGNGGYLASEGFAEIGFFTSQYRGNQRHVPSVRLDAEGLYLVRIEI